MVARVDELLPRDHLATLRRLAREIDDTLASFVRGQLTVCLILGTFYSVALMIVGLQFGLVVGAVAGLITFIPYVGAIVGGTLAIGLALVQFWGEWVQIGLVAGIFVLGQFLEGNILTPKLVGGSVGLHPVWLLFALSAFGATYGFVGMLVAVPVAAALGVIARFLVAEYKDSQLYAGRPRGRGARSHRARSRRPGTRPSERLRRGAAAQLPAAAAHRDGTRRPHGRHVERRRCGFARRMARLAFGPPGAYRSRGIGQDPPRAGLGRGGRRARVPAAGLRDEDAPELAEAPLALEDADRALAEGRVEATALFHLWNACARAGLPLLLTGRRPPADWPVALPDLASRLASLTPARIEPPDDALLSVLLVKLFADRQIAVRPALIGWLLLRIERTHAAAGAIVDALDRAALAQGRAVDLRLARDLLGERLDSDAAGA